ncbi:hypothetical protein DOTSEDRAFT_72379 [Dothistroma septosporum NZE10]|uniref:Uncharacterized protein n=1 Tax=Dothistroma septosporum (strain NZE10 / CBS 128990) TaxID=675120 RepID=M2YLN9_DOTSN|nr:hypothetical protein DOTSEDRAFT_72379 [Dothistroma septosporum NZE10]
MPAPFGKSTACGDMKYSSVRPVAQSGCVAVLIDIGELSCLDSRDACGPPLSLPFSSEPHLMPLETLDPSWGFSRRVQRRDFELWNTTAPPQVIASPVGEALNAHDELQATPSGGYRRLEASPTRNGPESRVEDLVNHEDVPVHGEDSGTTAGPYIDELSKSTPQNEVSSGLSRNDDNDVVKDPDVVVTISATELAETAQSDEAPVPLTTQAHITTLSGDTTASSSARPNLEGSAGPDCMWISDDDNSSNPLNGSGFRPIPKHILIGLMTLH